jgi:hypothetical protein
LEHFSGGKGITLKIKNYTREKTMKDKKVSPIERLSGQHIEGILGIHSYAHAGEDGEFASTGWLCRRCLKLSTHMELA